VGTPAKSTKPAIAGFLLFALSPRTIRMNEVRQHEAVRCEASCWTPPQPSFSRGGGPKRLALALGYFENPAGFDNTRPLNPRPRFQAPTATARIWPCEHCIAHSRPSSPPCPSHLHLGRLVLTVRRFR